jgi:hypothetical protein
MRDEHLTGLVSQASADNGKPPGAAPLTLRTIRRRLLKIFERAEQLWEELDELADLMPTPTKEQLWEMRLKGRLSSETYWLGVILEIYFCFEDISELAEQHSTMIPSAHRHRAGRDPGLVRLVELEIDLRAEEAEKERTCEQVTTR